MNKILNTITTLFSHKNRLPTATHAPVVHEEHLPSPDNSSVPQEQVALYVIRNYDRVAEENRRLREVIRMFRGAPVDELTADVKFLTRKNKNQRELIAGQKRKLTELNREVRDLRDKLRRLKSQ